MVLTYGDNSLCHVMFLSLHGKWYERVSEHFFVSTLLASQVLTTARHKIYFLSPYCMSCCLYCVPVCCRRQTFDHPYIQDPENEENFVEVDTHAPLVIWVVNIYTGLVVKIADYWDSEDE